MRILLLHYSLWWIEKKTWSSKRFKVNFNATNQFLVQKIEKIVRNVNFQGISSKITNFNSVGPQLLKISICLVKIYLLVLNQKKSHKLSIFIGFFEKSLKTLTITHMMSNSNKINNFWNNSMEIGIFEKEKKQSSKKNLIFQFILLKFVNILIFSENQ